MGHKKKSKHCLTKHHRKPSSIGGDSSPSNLSWLPANQHQAWHLCFSNMTAPTICAILNEKYIDPHYRFVCIPADKMERVLKHLSQLT